MRVLIIILFSLLLSAVVFLSGSPAAYCLVADRPLASSLAIASVPAPTFIVQPPSTIFALIDATYTTQIGMANFFTAPGYTDNNGVAKLTCASSGATTVSSISTGINTISNYPGDLITVKPCPQVIKASEHTLKYS